MAKRIAAFVALVAVLVTVLLMSQRGGGPLKVSGFVEADEIRVGSRVGGRVSAVAVQEGQSVRAEEVLVTLEPFDLQKRRAEAEAKLNQRRREYEKLVSGFREEKVAEAQARRDELSARLAKLINGPRKQELAAAEARLQLAGAELELAETQYRRIETLYGRQAATKEDLDAATNQLRVARAEHAVRTEELALLREGTRKEDIDEAKAQLEQANQAWLLSKQGYRPEEISEAKAAVDAAQATLEAVEAQLDELKITAPTNAVVEAVELQVGDLVAGGAPAISLMDTSRLWVRAYVPENRLDIHVGQKAWVMVDSYPGRQFAAHISFIARQAEFTPSNIQTPEERSKQVFRIKVELDEGLDRLRPGMAADVYFANE